MQLVPQKVPPSDVMRMTEHFSCIMCSDIYFIQCFLTLLCKHGLKIN